MNKVFLIGRLTKDPAIRYSNGEQSMSIARFTLAVDRRTKDKSADFISCVAFGKTAEFAEKYLLKGTKIALCGRVHADSYTNKDGVKVYSTNIIVDNLEFAGAKINVQGDEPLELTQQDESLAFIEN